jgi:hypothetical protein
MMPTDSQADLDFPAGIAAHTKNRSRRSPIVLAGFLGVAINPVAQLLRDSGKRSPLVYSKYVNYKAVKSDATE